VGTSSITLHPRGIPHGPQPGLVEKSLGAERTDELAVMVDTFRPLKLGADAEKLDDPKYPFSWLD
jgi:homogentisate 1,2-dioxygenase